MNSTLGRAGFVQIGAQDAAEQWLRMLPQGYCGRTSKTESGKWAVSYRYQGN